VVLPTLAPLGDQALLLRWGDAADVELNAHVHAFAARVRAVAPPWLVDCVPAYASLALFFDGGALAGADPVQVVGDWVSMLSASPVGAQAMAEPRLVEIPVHYGGGHGPDLADVAEASGLEPADVVARHADAEYRVAMLGFSPGFPYLLGLDPALAVPRLSTPRLRVPAGSVGIGGAQTGVYPDAGPGGWRLIGRTPRVLFDPQREAPSLLLPGDRLRFRPMSAEEAASQSWERHEARRVEPERADVEVLSPGLQTTVQDLGRAGHRHLGVGIAGALDPYSARIANRLVGNDEGAALLEVALQGPRLRLSRPARIAIAGAEIEAHADGVALPGWRPIDLPAGSELVLGACRRGARAYVAFAGGVHVPRVLGSAATDLRAGLGGVHGRALLAGDRLALGEAAIGAVDAPWVAPWWVDPSPDLDFRAAPVPIRVLPGHDALAAPGALDAHDYRVTAQSNRQGLRLQGPPLRVADPGERLSEPVAPGTVQLPPDGQPIVLLAEAQTIGGYPRIGHVIAADLPRLAQLRPGDSVRFGAVDAPAAHALACSQRRRLSRIAIAIELRRRER
jgi:KipI family sensor histidine kinase inhibitor